MEPSQGSTKRRVAPEPARQPKHPHLYIILPWVLTAVLAAVMVILLIPRISQPDDPGISPTPATAPAGSAVLSSLPTQDIEQADSLPLSTAEPTAAATQTAAVSPAEAPSAPPQTQTPTAAPTATDTPEPMYADNIRMLMSNGRLHISWDGTPDGWLVRAADTGDGLPDEEVFEEVHGESSSATLLRILPGHSYDVCMYPARADQRSPFAITTSYRAEPAVSLNKYNLQLAAMDIFFSDASGLSQARSSITGKSAAQVISRLDGSGSACMLELRLSHQRIRDNRDVHYSLEFKAPNGAICALNAEGTLLLASSDVTICTFDCTDLLRVLNQHQSLTSGWYTISLNIDGMHAVKTSFLLE